MQPINKIPEWQLQSIFDEAVPTIKSFQGKPLLILFFNLGCPGCKGRALPFANRIVVENGTAINVVGIHTRFEGPQYNFNHFQKAKKDYFIRFPFYKDIGYTTFDLYNAGGTPHWILLNEKGALEYSIFGSDPNNALLRLGFKIEEVLTL